MNTSQQPSAPGRTKVTILVNNKPFHLESMTVTAATLRTLAGSPAEYEVWKIVKDPDPEGQLPVDDIQVTGSVDVESGDRFRVVPPGTFGGNP